MHQVKPFNLHDCPHPPPRFACRPTVHGGQVVLVTPGSRSSAELSALNPREGMVVSGGG